MSYEVLVALRNAHAFDSAPPMHKLGRTHVPFDTLTNSGAYENALLGAANRRERVALIGASGSGKSSITAHVFGPPLPGLAPIPISVDLEDDEIAERPGAFAAHLVRTITGLVHAVSPADAPAADKLEQIAVAGAPVAGAKHATATVGPPWLNASLAADLGGAVRLKPTGADQVVQARLALDIVLGHDLVPVLLLDDTDHWLASGTRGAPDDRISAFFGPVVRLIGEGLGDICAVVAVHDSYLAHPGYKAAQGFLETRITLPRLPGRNALAHVLSSRAYDATGRPQPLETFISPDALEQLWALYSGTGEVDVRTLLRVAHAALGHACDAGSEHIGVRDIDQGVG